MTRVPRTSLSPGAIEPTIRMLRNALRSLQKLPADNVHLIKAEEAILVAIDACTEESKP